MSSSNNRKNQIAFKPETINSIFKAEWKSESTRAKPDALQLSAEYLRLFTIEAVHRASMEAKKEGSKVLEVEHLERIVAQLVLDF